MLPRIIIPVDPTGGVLATDIRDSLQTSRDHTLLESVSEATHFDPKSLIAGKVTVYIADKDGRGRPNKFSPGVIIGTDFNPGDPSKPKNFQIKLNSGQVRWVSADNLMVELSN